MNGLSTGLECEKGRREEEKNPPGQVRAARLHTDLYKYSSRGYDRVNGFLYIRLKRFSMKSLCARTRSTVKE
jgi:hypothetical protein